MTVRLCCVAAAMLTTVALAAPADELPWALRPLDVVNVPAVENGWARNEIDRFVSQRLDARPAPQADRRTLIRRVCFDLIGLPPTAAEIETFLADTREDAYERLVERLLCDPRFGEHQARMWLDVVRYAESDGYKADVYRPDAWRYRDYVIRAFNGDMPYDRFLQEQLAGDELFPGDLNARIATGYLRLWPYEDNQADVARQWEAILTDITDVTGEALLGLSFGCARCHDHKYDPIRREDYYRLRAFFSGILPRTDMTLASAEELESYRTKLAEWEAATAPIRSEIEVIENAAIDKGRADSISRYPHYLQAIYATAAEQRTPLEQQYHYLAEIQTTFRSRMALMLLPADEKERLKELHERLREYNAMRPSLPSVLAVTDVGLVAAPTFIPGREDRPIEPGLLSVWDPSPADIRPVAGNAHTTGRRAALARMLTDPQSPAGALVARVMVNRIWQQHFGKGLVATPNDFGDQGEGPWHPQLLDWLARRFIDSGWSNKDIHRLVVTSSAYRQSVTGEGPTMQRVRRLRAEQVRDAMLTVSGEMDPTSCGEGVDGSIPRRSIYVKAIRNRPDGMLGAFDLPDSFTSCGRRSVTTTPLQSLMLINGPFTAKRAEALARRVAAEGSSDPPTLIERASLHALGRPPTPTEQAAARSLFQQASSDEEALIDFCHVLLNSNAFIYLD